MFLLNYGNKCFEAYSKLFVQYLVYYTIFVNSKKMKKFNKIVVGTSSNTQTHFAAGSS
jgi:hypothetical protein